MRAFLSVTMPVYYCIVCRANALHWQIISRETGLGILTPFWGVGVGWGVLLNIQILSTMPEREKDWGGGVGGGAGYTKIGLCRTVLVFLFSASDQSHILGWKVETTHMSLYTRFHDSYTETVPCGYDIKIRCHCIFDDIQPSKVIISLNFQFIQQWMHSHHWNQQKLDDEQEYTLSWSIKSQVIESRHDRLINRF